MPRMSYSEYKGKLDRFELREYHSHHFEFLLEQFEKIVNPEDIEVFYPKKIFSRDSETELYIFTKDTLHVLTGSRRLLNMKSVPLSSIKYREYNVSNEYNLVASLKLHYNDSYFYLQSEEDSNDDWSGTYAEIIMDIMKLF